MPHFPLTPHAVSVGGGHHDEVVSMLDKLADIVAWYSSNRDLSPEDGFHLGRIKLAIKYLEEAIGIVEEDHDPRDNR